MASASSVAASSAAASGYEPAGLPRRSERPEPPQRLERRQDQHDQHDQQDRQDRWLTELARLAAAVGPLRRVMAAVAARRLGARGHEPLCFARVGDYARERPGVSRRQIQELARVHRALAELPLLEAALLANLLPWSKVRLIASVATPTDELAWIARGRAVSVRSLAGAVRRARADEAGDPGAPGTCRLTERCTPAVREQWVWVRELAERMAGRRLNAGEALELVVAEVLSAVPIDPALAPVQAVRRQRVGSADPLAGDEPAAARAPAAELPADVAALAEGLDEADAFELDRRLREAVRLEQGLDAAMAPLLRALRGAGRRGPGTAHRGPGTAHRGPGTAHRGPGTAHRSLARLAPEQLGMSPSKARALIRLERAAEICPELREAWRSGRLSWVKAQCLLPLLLLDMEGPWRPAWVAWAQRVTLRRLEADVERALLLRAGHRRAWLRCHDHPERAQDPISDCKCQICARCERQTCAHGEGQMFARSEGQRCAPGERQMCAHDLDVAASEALVWDVPAELASLFSALIATLRGRMCSVLGRVPSRGEVFEAMLELARRSWCANEPGARRPESRHPVMARDGWRCAAPGCSSRAELHDHHIVFRSAGGSDALENRITLCAFHHHRCLHAGRMRVAGRAPHGLVFELGVRAGAPPLARYRSGDVLAAGGPDGPEVA